MSPLTRSPGVAEVSTVNALGWDGDQTSPLLLYQVRDWQNRAAWQAFFDKYDPLLRFWCRRDCLTGDAADELCQGIWIELMVRMRTFRYDPSRGFRCWLKRLYRSRAIDLARRRMRSAMTSLHQPYQNDRVNDMFVWSDADSEPDDDREAESAALFVLAEAVQNAVRTRVDHATWRAFEMIAIEDRTVSDTAQELGMKYTAVYNGFRRVDRMLRQEGERSLGNRVTDVSVAADIERIGE